MKKTLFILSFLFLTTVAFTQTIQQADNAENEVTIIIANSTELSKQTEALRELVERIRDAAVELTDLIRG